MATATADVRTRPIDHTLFLLTLALIVTGLVLVFSATFPVESRPDADGMPGDPYARVQRHAVAVLIGFAVLLALTRVKPVMVQRLAAAAFFATLGLLALVHVPGFGREVNGATRWLVLPGLPPFQPSVLVKLTLTLYLAQVLGREQREGGAFAVSVGKALFWTVVAGGLILLQPDLGTAVVLFGICLGVLFLGGLHPVLVGLMASGGAAGAVAFAKFTGYGWDRIVGFWDPVGHAKDQGFHVLKMMGALARGGVFGLGLAQSPDKWFRFPARHTDSIYCILGGELGLVGCLALLLVLGWMARRVMVIAAGQRDRFSATLAGGLGVVIFVQATVNIAVATKLLPCTGLTLPFLSYGGTSIVTCMAAVGLLLALSRHAVAQAGWGAVDRGRDARATRRDAGATRRDAGATRRDAGATHPPFRPSN